MTVADEEKSLPKRLAIFQRTQEIRPFRKIDDSFKKIVVTKDIIAPYYDEYGILTMNIYDFLLNPRSLEQ